MENVDSFSQVKGEAMKRAMTILLLALAISSPAAQRPAFDVASIKSTAEVIGPGRPQVSSPPNEFYRRGITLAGLIQFAYGIGYFQIVGIPVPLQRETYVVTARTETFPGTEVMRLMVQSLLEDRFKLRVTRADKEMEFEALQIARADGRLGPNLKKCEGGQDLLSTPPKRVALRKGSTSKVGLCATMVDLAGALSTLVSKPVIDETSLAGIWNYEFTFADQRLMRGIHDSTDAQPSAPSLIVALRDDLGLRLHTSKGRVPVLVVLSAAPPTPN